MAPALAAPPAPDRGFLCKRAGRTMTAVAGLPNAARRATRLPRVFRGLLPRAGAMPSGTGLRSCTTFQDQADRSGPCQRGAGATGTRSRSGGLFARPFGKKGVQRGRIRVGAKLGAKVGVAH